MIYDTYNDIDLALYSIDPYIMFYQIINNELL